MIVIDASAAISALLNDGPARQLLVGQRLHAPYLIDTEVAGALRRQVLAGTVTAEQGRTALDTWRRLAVARYPAQGLLDRIWQLRHTVSAYDATYVALAEGLGCPLATLDGRLAGGSSEFTCPVTVLPA